MTKIWDKSSKYSTIHIRSLPFIAYASTPCIRSEINCLMDKQVTWEIMTIKWTNIIDGCWPPWLLILFPDMLIRFEWYSPIVWCNMSIIMVYIALDLIHQAEKGVLTPPLKYTNLISWNEWSYSHTCFVRFCSWFLLDLSLPSSFSTLPTTIFCCRIFRICILVSS